jgi:hypothetical protein
MEQPVNDNVVPPEEPNAEGAETFSRRRLLRALAATGGAVAGASLLPGEWVKPVIEAGVLPAHAQVTEVSPAPGCGNIPFSQWILIGDAQVDPDPDWVRLTSATGNQAGGALTPIAFDPAAGFTARFTYATYGGSGADGICVAFFDGATTNPQLGPPGGSLGYSYDPGSGQDGLTNAYLGVGLDEFGNFSAPSDNPDGPGQQPQSFVLRGSGNGSNGYRYLDGVPASNFGTTIDGVTRANPRQVEIGLINGVVTLRVDFGSGFQTVLTYHIAGAPGQAPLPATLRVAISASTGGSTNVHEIGDFELIC